MLKELSFNHFKCFSSINISLRPLTLFCGVNSVGKSTAIQGLAVLNQTISENEWNQDIHLNGDNVCLGSSEDVVNQSSGRRSFSIGVKTDKALIKWTAGNTSRKDLLVSKVIAVSGESEENIIKWPSGPPRGLHRLIPLSLPRLREATKVVKAISRIKYLSAERIGPREIYSLSPKSRLNTVGAKGEWTAHFLSEFEDSDANTLLAAGCEGKTVRKAVEYWMNRLFPGFGFSIQRIPGTGLVTLQIRTSDSKPMFRPQNVGFGLTHVLPIVTACVASKAGDIVIIENPEAHLHPAGQSTIGLFLGITSASGVQVIVETHSDHVLNGIRKAVSRHVIDHENVIFNFFHRDPDDAEESHKVTALTCDEGGKISKWPKMFFDQMQIDLLELA